MTERDTDIEFDFFDEPETEEATERTRVPRRPPRDGPPPRQRVRAPQGFIPMLRLAGLIAFLILAVIVLIFLLKGCASSSKHARYSNYMEKMTTIGNDSAQLGKQLNSSLAATGIKETDLEAKIRGYAATQQQQADQASSVNAPGPLHTEHAHAIEVLQLRASGLSRLADAFAQTATSKDASAAGKLLADQMRLLVASDVNWDFYFTDASRRVLRDQGVTDVNVPDSTMIANPDLASSQAMESVWRRVHGTTPTTTPAGDHGSALVSVTALPDGKRLDPSGETTVTSTTDLAFRVSVMDSGSFQEFNIKVTLTIAKTGAPIVKSKTIDIINAGETKSVVFSDFNAVPFGVPTTVKVDVQPVPGEKTTTNNSAEYRVIFSLG